MSEANKLIHASKNGSTGISWCTHTFTPYSVIGDKICNNVSNYWTDITCFKCLENGIRANFESAKERYQKFKNEFDNEMKELLK